MISALPLDNLPALVLSNGDERVLVVGDMHIGWEVALAQQGIHVPSQTNKLLEKLTTAVTQSKPKSVVFLGDVKHTIVGAEMEEWRDVPEFFEKLTRLVSEIHVVKGNHDGNLEPLTPRNVTIHSSEGMALWGEYGLFHGHAWPGTSLLGCETLIMGHLHPVVQFVDRLGYRMTKPVWVRAAADPARLAKAVLLNLGIRSKEDPHLVLKEKFGVELRTARCVFAPPFNDFLGGRPINRQEVLRRFKQRGRPLGPLLKAKILNIDEAEVVMLDGTFLGNVKQLRSYSEASHRKRS